MHFIEIYFLQKLTLLMVLIFTKGGLPFMPRRMLHVRIHTQFQTLFVVVLNENFGPVVCSRLPRSNVFILKLFFFLFQHNVLLCVKMAVFVQKMGSVRVRLLSLENSVNQVCNTFVK